MPSWRTPVGLYPTIKSLVIWLKARAPRVSSLPGRLSGIEVRRGSLITLLPSALTSNVAPDSHVTNKTLPCFSHRRSLTLCRTVNFHELDAPSELVRRACGAKWTTIMNIYIYVYLFFVGRVTVI